LTWNDLINVSDLNNGKTIEFDLPRACMGNDGIRGFVNNFSNLYFVIDYVDACQDMSAVQWMQGVESFVFESIEVWYEGKLFYSITSKSMYTESLISGKISTNKNMNRLIVPFYHFLGKTIRLMPQSSLKSQFKFKIKLRDHQDHRELVVDNLHQPIDTSIGGCTLVTKTVLLEDCELRGFRNSKREMFLDTLKEVECLLNKDTTEYQIQLFNECDDTKKLSFGSLFLYFTKGKSLLPYYENNFIEMILMVDSVPYISICKDLLERICEIETESHYNLPNIFNYTIKGPVLRTDHISGATKGAPLSAFRDVRLIVRLKSGFTSTRLSVICAGERVFYINDGRIVDVMP
jgi:hypothetical protein